MLPRAGPARAAERCGRRFEQESRDRPFGMKTGKHVAGRARLARVISRPLRIVQIGQDGQDPAVPDVSRRQS